MREKEDLKFYRKLMKHEVSVDRNKTAPKCKNCCYYHPDFKYRRCLYSICPYGKPEEQKNLIEAMDFTQAAPSLSQAMRLKKLSQENGCSLEDMCVILGEVKKGDLERVAFKSEQLRKYFPKSYTPRQMSDVILKLLDQWQKKRQRDKER